MRKVEFNPINGIRARAILGKRLVGSEVEKQWIEALGAKSFSQEGAVILIRRPDGKTLRSCCDITSQVVVINGPLSTFRDETDSATRMELGPVEVIGKFRIDYVKRPPRIEDIKHDIGALVRLIGNSHNLLVECAVEMPEKDRNRVRAVYGYILWPWNNECDRGYCSGRKN